MWNYEKRLQYPVKITQTNPQIAQVIISQYGGPDGELAASMRYLAQRYTMPYNTVAGVLTDIGVSVAILRIWNGMCKNKELLARANSSWYQSLMESSIISMARISVV